MICGVEKVVEHRGDPYQTAHVCKRRRGHRGWHHCKRARLQNKACPYKWPKQRRARPSEEEQTK